jgi:hypothetical protein
MLFSILQAGSTKDSNTLISWITKISLFFSYQMYYFRQILMSPDNGDVYFFFKKQKVVDLTP